MHKRNLELLTLVVMLVLVILLNIAIFKKSPNLNSKAQIKLDQAFEIKDENGNIINCNNNVCPTNSSIITIKLINLQLLNQK